jgi:hypothetical protein
VCFTKASTIGLTCDGPAVMEMDGFVIGFSHVW